MGPGEGVGGGEEPSVVVAEHVELAGEMGEGGKGIVRRGGEEKGIAADGGEDFEGGRWLWWWWGI